MTVNHKKPHRNLLDWQKPMDLAIKIYQSTTLFPEMERYSLTSQLRRATISVPSNIAEGAADKTALQFHNFLANAIGSLNEIDIQLELAFRLNYFTATEYHQLASMVDECLAITFGLKKPLRSTSTGK